MHTRAFSLLTLFRGCNGLQGGVALLAPELVAARAARGAGVEIFGVDAAAAVAAVDYVVALTLEAGYIVTQRVVQARLTWEEEETLPTCNMRLNSSVWCNGSTNV